MLGKLATIAVVCLALAVFLPVPAWAEVTQVRHIEGSSMVLGTEAPPLTVSNPVPGAPSSTTLFSPAADRSWPNRSSPSEPSAGAFFLSLFLPFLLITAVVLLFKGDELQQNPAGTLFASAGIAIFIMVVLPLACLVLLVVLALSVPAATTYLVTVRQI